MLFLRFRPQQKKTALLSLFKGRFAVFCFVPPPFLRRGFARAEELKRGGRLNLNRRVFYACFLVISKKEATVPLIAASRKKTAPVITVLPVEIAFGKISNSSLEKNVQPRPVKEP